MIRHSKSLAFNQFYSMVSPHVVGWPLHVTSYHAPLNVIGQIENKPLNYLPTGENSIRDVKNVSR